jgi:Holliday junction resolvase RusA-like endonuclease
MMEFRIPGPIKPYVRMTRRSKFVNRQAVAYNTDQMRVKWELRDQMTRSGWEMIPRGRPLAIGVLITMTGRLHCQDADNQLKGVIDALQGVVFENDLWVDFANVYRKIGDSDLVEVHVGTIDDYRVEQLAMSRLETSTGD